MPLRWILFDWGDTLMSEAGPVELPMARWPEVRAIDGAHAVLSTLARDYAIGVATNAAVSSKDEIVAALARVDLAPLVRELFCYRELGCKKRDPAFWAAVLARLGVAADEIVMIGDHLGDDVLAPRRAGIASIWLNWKEVTTPHDLEAPVATSLAEIPSLLADWPLPVA